MQPFYALIHVTISTSRNRELKFTKVAKSKPCLGRITHVEACNLIFDPFSYFENMLICLSSYSYPATMPLVLIYNPVAKTRPSVTPASNLLVCKIVKFLSCEFFVKLTSYKFELGNNNSRNSTL